VILGQANLQKLQRECGVPGQAECLLFREALQRMTINMDVDEPLMKEWVVRVDRESNAYSAIPTTMKSMSMTRSMYSKTNQFMRGYNSKSAFKIINKGGEPSGTSN